MGPSPPAVAEAGPLSSVEVPAWQCATSVGRHLIGVATMGDILCTQPVWRGLRKVDLIGLPMVLPNEMIVLRDEMRRDEIAWSMTVTAVVQPSQLFGEAGIWWVGT